MTYIIQECIPVGCRGGGGVCLGGVCPGRGCLPRGRVSARGCLAGDVCLGGGCLPRGGVHLPPWTEFLTHACENITFP